MEYLLWLSGFLAGIGAGILLAGYHARRLTLDIRSNIHLDSPAGSYLMPGPTETREIIN